MPYTHKIVGRVNFVGAYYEVSVPIYYNSFCAPRIKEVKIKDLAHRDVYAEKSNVCAELFGVDDLTEREHVLSKYVVRHAFDDERTGSILNDTFVVLFSECTESVVFHEFGVPKCLAHDLVHRQPIVFISVVFVKDVDFYILRN